MRTIRSQPAAADERGSAVASAALPGVWRLICRFRMAGHLNTNTRRGEIGTSMPFLGLRPIRWPFLRTTHEPNDDNITVSPFSRQSVLSFTTDSTQGDHSV